METVAPRRMVWRERWEILRRPLALALAMFYALVLFFAFSWSRCFFSTCPDVKKLAAFQPGGAPLVLDRNGEVFADLAPAERQTAALSSLPGHVAQAFLAVEDKRFYQHRGIDWRRVGGAVFANLHSGNFAQGFSTLTMQLARNVFPERIPGEEQTTSRKLLEIRVAQEIEARYSKEEILELYLNNIYFGNRARGIEAAANQYFGHPAKDLTLAQAALLAALPKAPTHYDPRRHPDKALERRNLVLALMEEQGRVPRRMAEEAKRMPLGLSPPPRQARVESGLAPWFVEQVRHEMEERFGPELYTRSLRIVTTLDSAAQRAAEEELRAQLKRVESGELGAFDGQRYSPAAEAPDDGTPYLQGAAVMLDAHDGDVLAWVGGRDYAHSQFDRVVQARRQPGSAFKPFIYAAALAHGWVLSQPLIDQPLRVKMSNGQVWQPRNFTGQYDGEVTMRDALVRSKNVATVRLADAVGLSEVSALAKAAGISEPIPPVPAIALGTVAVSPLELTSAYTAFASLGQAAEPRLILRVEDDDGKVFWRSQPSRHAVLDPAVAFLVTNVLSEALTSGTGNLVQQTGLKAPAAGKTGTTNDGADVWFVGYTPEIVGGVWIGFDKPRPILESATGGRLAAPAWGRMLTRVYQKRPQPKPWTTPDGVVSRPVDATGLIVEKGCSPLAGEVRSELFIDGKEPAAYCPGQEAPPRNGFPSQALLAEREKGREEDAERAERIARIREEEKRRLREQKEAERIAKVREEGEERRLRKQQEAERIAQEKVRLAEQKARLLEEKRAAEKRAAQEKEQAGLQARKERIAREEAEADRREREIAAREKAQRKAELERRERELAAREEALRKAERKRTEEERIARVLQEERRARDDEEGTREERQPVRRAERYEPEEPPAEMEREPVDDLSGWWELTNTIQSTNFAEYQGLRLSYRLQLEQDGDRITGRGQKWSEDGRPVPAAGRTPLTVSGTIEGGKVTLQFTERGARRSTAGGFSWHLSSSRASLRGTFWSNAANTSGASVARRMD
ncbi:MAG: penicillin-binding protein [Acidobacteriota bacterium]|nr:penicillin-binding protein [Acidobacteriota bacterium]